MHRYLEVCLSDRHSKLFRCYRTQPKFPHHFECGNGWFPLIAKWAHTVEWILEYEKQHGLQVFCVKEKFGTLTIQCLFEDDNNISESVRQKIRYFTNGIEVASSIICERCGDPGHLWTDGGWRHCMCNRCHKEYMEVLEMDQPGWKAPDHSDIERLLEVALL